MFRNQLRVYSLRYKQPHSYASGLIERHVTRLKQNHTLFTTEKDREAGCV